MPASRSVLWKSNVGTGSVPKCCSGVSVKQSVKSSSCVCDLTLSLYGRGNDHLRRVRTLCNLGAFRSCLIKGGIALSGLVS